MRKVLIILILIIVILLIGFAVYQYFTKGYPFKGLDVQNSTNGAQVEKVNNGSFSVCLDECGNGICQTADPSLKESDSLNDVCLETPQECPQDCKQ